MSDLLDGIEIAALEDLSPSDLLEEARMMAYMLSLYVAEYGHDILAKDDHIGQAVRIVMGEASH